MVMSTLLVVNMSAWLQGTNSSQPLAAVLAMEHVTAGHVMGTTLLVVNSKTGKSGDGTGLCIRLTIMS